MHFKALNPGHYLGAADILSPTWPHGKEPTLTIQSVAMEDIDEDRVKKTKETKGMVKFVECSKGWLMNVINATSLAAMFGEDTTTWTKKRVTLKIERVSSFGEMVPGVRVRGSPDLAANKSVTLVQRKKKPVVVNLEKTTGAKSNGPIEVVTFGPKKGAQIATLTPTELAESIALGDANVAKEPGAKWAGKIKAEVEALRAEVVKREAIEAALPPAEEVPAPF